MNDYTAMSIAAGLAEPESEEHAIEAWQHLVNMGLCWTLPGCFSRTAQELIDNGLINLPQQEEEK